MVSESLPPRYRGHHSAIRHCLLGHEREGYSGRVIASSDPCMFGG